ncbi:unnamed protein product [Cylicocyclus nassatus]|uniref:Uncharacterized protein n=1 Tax=Cylicocyclus nassatus TaxID=53992 RepID=A0AA36HFV8_CYLNA|nr:unnamed protein product [Cylicocyclus nassatus]
MFGIIKILLLACALASVRGKLIGLSSSSHVDTWWEFEECLGKCDYDYDYAFNPCMRECLEELEGLRNTGILNHI